MKGFVVDIIILIVMFVLVFNGGKIVRCFKKPDNTYNVKMDYFSLYEWHYHKAADGLEVAQAFGRNTENGDNAFLHIRGENEVYFCQYDEKNLIRTRTYTLEVNGIRFSTFLIKQKQSLKIKHNPRLFIKQISTPQFNVMLYTNGKYTATYKFDVGKPLTDFNTENLVK